MHSFLTGYDRTDHHNTVKLDNRRVNLRNATTQQNGMNRRKQKMSSSSAFKGVTWHKRDKKWQAAIGLDGRTIHLGYFSIESEAAEFYDMTAIRIFGEWACTNKFLGLLP
jgi:AP2 domain